MYTFEELRRAAMLLIEVADKMHKTDSSGHGVFSLCADVGTIQIFPAAQRPSNAIEIVSVTKREILLGLDCKKWDLIHRVLRDFVKEGILK